MKRSNRLARRACLLVALSLAVALPGGLHAQEDHSHHHHGGGVPPMDGDGKRLESYGQPHDMTPEMREGQRKKVALYRGMTDRELDMNMNVMGPDYEWYVIVVSIAAASFGVQQHIKTDLKGLKYTFAGQGLSEHPKFVQWVESTIDQTLVAAPAKTNAPAPRS